MSDDAKPGTPPPATGDQPNRAQAEFERYKARLGGMQPTAAVLLPWGGMPPPGGTPGWGMPPSVASVGQAAAAGFPALQVPAQPAGGRPIADQLGDTLRLGIDLVNAALSNGARMLAGGMGAVGGWGQGASFGGGWSGHGLGGGCGCPSCCEPSCGCPSCCAALSCDPCCSPGVRGCC